MIYKKKISSYYDSLLQINFENFVMGWTVGFQAVLSERLAFTTLDENWIVHAHARDAMSSM